MADPNKNHPESAEPNFVVPDDIGSVVDDVYDRAGQRERAIQLAGNALDAATTDEERRLAAGWLASMVVAQGDFIRQFPELLDPDHPNSQRDKPLETGEEH